MFQVILQQTKHFTCECQRCLDPSEFGTNLSAIRCPKCKIGDVLPLKPTNLKTDFECQDCHEVIEAGLVSLFVMGEDNYHVTMKLNFRVK